MLSETARLVEEAIATYYRLKTEEPHSYVFSELHLNALGYHLIFRQGTDNALEIFRLNVEGFPNSSNVYDSYGKALLANGDTIQSIKNYPKSLELDSGNTDAREIINRFQHHK